MLASRREGSHNCLCFVREDFHRQGIGRSLWEHFLAETCAKRITVHSSSYAVGFYHRLGFLDTAEEQQQNGIRFTPMEYTR